MAPSQLPLWNSASAHANWQSVRNLQTRTNAGIFFISNRKPGPHHWQSTAPPSKMCVTLRECHAVSSPLGELQSRVTQMLHPGADNGHPGARARGWKRRMHLRFCRNVVEWTPGKPRPLIGLAVCLTVRTNILIPPTPFFYFNFANSFLTFQAGCPPCEAYSLKNITIFLERLHNLLEQIKSDGV